MKRPVEILTPTEAEQLLKQCSAKAPTGIRNRALITLLYRGGLRISEALALKVDDLDATAGTINIRHGKGDKQRTVGLDPGAFALINLWAQQRKQHGLNGRHPLISTLQGGPLEPAYVRALLPRLARKAGIGKRVHAHGLRHTHAAELAQEGKPMNLIQAQLGHANLNVTSRYLDHIQPRELIGAIQAREWHPNL
jgi:site-specific recombinase XerD